MHFENVLTKEVVVMKRLFKGHIYLGRMGDRRDDEFIDCVDLSMNVKPEGLRWFCGMHDLDATFICQAL